MSLWPSGRLGIPGHDVQAGLPGEHEDTAGQTNTIMLSAGCL